MALEQYQSEFTAEEFENAIRAVPKIGANGNWFIGDKDTGVFAGGVKITGAASVGQTIVVKAVDETGRPTLWEPSDLVKKTKIVTILDFTAENDLVLSNGDDDDLSFGDAVVGHNHFFYKTADGNQLKAKRIFGYIYAASAISGYSMRFSPYYKDGTPTSWMFGDFLGNATGIAQWVNDNFTIQAGKYHVFESSADMSRTGFVQTGNLKVSTTVNRIIAYHAINAQFPHLSGVKLNGKMTLPTGSKFVIMAEVEDDA